jgi:histidinol-phosphate aminotransferase
MSKYWNERTSALEPYVPGEQPRDRKFIKLNTNENPYPPSPKVTEAVGRVLAQDGETLRLYPDPACTTLRSVIAERYGVKPEQVFAGNGSDEVLAFAFAAFFPTASITGDGSDTSGGSAVLFPDITYSFYSVYANLWDVPYKKIPLDTNFAIRAADYRVPNGGIIFPNPNAPTGRALDVEQILSLAEFQEKQGRVLIVDEAYAAFGAESAVPHIKAYPNMITVHTLSKSASLAGMRVGFAIAQEELIEGLCRVRDSFNSYTLDCLAQAAAAAAIVDTAYYDEITARVIATRERVAAELEADGFTVIPSAANFLFIRFPNISGAGAFAKLRERGILVRHFNKERIGDFLRVSVGTGEEMDVFLAACKEIAAN